jgi:hypothetical protein
MIEWMVILLLTWAVSILGGVGLLVCAGGFAFAFTEAESLFGFIMGIFLSALGLAVTITSVMFFFKVVE